MWSRLKHRLFFLARRGRIERELAEEMDLHRRLLERDHARRGLDPAAASRRARLQLGNATASAEDARAVWLFARLETLVADLRYALRAMRKGQASPP
jgi:hypothetical protein